MSGSPRSSDSEGGGARLVSSATSVSEDQQDLSLGSSPDDDKGAHAKLIQASASFGSDSQRCYNTGPLVAQSVPPMTDVFGQGSPYRREGQYHNRQNGTQALARYGHRHNVSTDSANSVFGSGPTYGNSSGFVAGNVPGNMNSNTITADIHRRIMTAQQLVTRAQGVPANVAREHEALLKGISQTITSFTAEMTQARDYEANRYKQAIYNRVPSFDDAQSKIEIQQLQHELSMKVARMEHLEEQVETYRAQALKAEEEATRIEKSALKFRRHHCKVIDEYKEQDNAHYKQFEQQDAEMRALRDRIDELSIQQNSQALVRASDFAEQTSVMGSRRSDNETPRAGHFNPQAPAWSPEHAMMSPPTRPVSRFVRENSSQFGSQASMGSPFAHLSSPSGVVSPRTVAFASGGAPLNDSPDNSPADGDEMPSLTGPWGESEVRQALKRLYDLVKGVIVRCHKDGKPLIADEQIKERVPRTFEFMIELVYPDNRQQGISHLQHIMRVPNYRPYLLQRMMLDYLFKKMLGPSLFMGFTLEMDGHLKALQDQISNMANTGGRSTSRDRQRVIDQHANLLRAIIRHPHSKNWRKAKVSRFSEMLCLMLEPMRSESVSRDTAMQWIRIIVNTTWTISEKIWSSGMTLHYLFPECGCKFACGSMNAVNQTEIQVKSQEQLQYNQYRVLLVITPTLTLRDERNPDRLRTSGISRSDVIVMK